MKILGISGSPIKNSNTDRAVQIVMEATGTKKREFIKLSDHTVAPCDACLGCVTTNRCVIKDDGIMLVEKAYKADALIVGGFTTYSSLDSRTKAFIERLYALRHRHGLMAGKPGAAIVTCAIPPGSQEMPSACANGLQAIRDYMEIEGMEFVGGISILGNMPCMKCSDQCQQSGLKMLYGPDAVPKNVELNNLEDKPEIVAALEKLGEDIMARYFGSSSAKY